MSRFVCRPKAWFILAQGQRPGLTAAKADAKGVNHTSPGQSPGNTGQRTVLALKARFKAAMRQAVGLQLVRSLFSDFSTAPSRMTHPNS